MFSSVIYREEDSIDEFISLQTVLKEFIAYDFAKAFNMSVDEYLSLTFFEKNYLIQAARYRDKIMREQLAKSEKIRNDKMKNGALSASDFGNIDPSDLGM